MKILFLDIDGVLNSRKSYIGMTPIDIESWNMLKKVLEKTDTKIVLSSTWRKGERDKNEYLVKLEEIGLFDYTHEDWRTITNLPQISDFIYPSRGDEIQEWLDRHSEVDNYAIIDDDTDMRENQIPHFVQTDFDSGMLPIHAEMLIEILTPCVPTS